MIDWRHYQRLAIKDGKFNMTNPEVPFPGYIDNPQFPFSPCISINYNGTAQTTEWEATDSQDAFKENLKTQPNDWKYRTKKIYYNLNSSGYRTYEWNNINWKESVVIIGCSHTYGIGLAEDETISYLLEKMLGRQVVNLGNPSTGSSVILNHCSNIIEKFDAPYAIIINWPPAPRLRYYTNERIIDLGSWTNPLNIDNSDLFAIYLNMFSNVTNTMCYNYYIANVARSLFKDRSKYISISYCEDTAHYVRADAYFQMIPTARDLIHPGYENSQEVVSYLTEKLA